MKLSNAYKYVKTAIKSKVSVMMWGPPGCGKSSVVHQIANELNMNVMDLRLAQLDPTDLRGLPMTNNLTKRADWFLPSFWPDRATEPGVRTVTNEKGKEQKIEYGVGDCPKGPGIIFLDEIEKAPISVKNASLQLVLDRRVGSYELPNDWAIVCAGNREEDGCFSQPLGAALSNRMIHLDVEPDVETWSAWAREEKVLDDVIGFLHFRQDLLYKQTDDHAFPTPRSWVIGSNLMKNVDNDKMQKDLLSAAVGSGPASEFTVWRQVYKNVDPEAVFNGKMPEFPDPKDQSFKYAVTMAVAFHLRNRKGGIKKCEEHVAKFLELLGCELRVVFLKQQTNGTLEAMMKHDAFKTMVREVMKIVT